MIAEYTPPPVRTEERGCDWREGLIDRPASIGGRRGRGEREKERERQRERLPPTNEGNISPEICPTRRYMYRKGQKGRYKEILDTSKNH